MKSQLFVSEPDATARECGRGKPLDELPGNALRRAVLDAAHARSDELRITGKICDEVSERLRRNWIGQNWAQAAYGRQGRS